MQKLELGDRDLQRGVIRRSYEEQLDHVIGMLPQDASWASRLMGLKVYGKYDSRFDRRWAKRFLRTREEFHGVSSDLLSAIELIDMARGARDRLLATIGSSAMRTKLHR
jgi:hypothetical protein